MARESSPKPIPTPSPATEWFWDACDEERLLLQQCKDCSSFRAYPARVCRTCNGTDWTAVEADDTGTIESVTVVHHAPSEPFRADTPYVLALIELRDGVRVMGNVRDCDPESVSIGDPVELVWETREEGKIYQFEPTEPTRS